MAIFTVILFIIGALLTMSAFWFTMILWGHVALSLSEKKYKAACTNILFAAVLMPVVVFLLAAGSLILLNEILY